MTFPLFLSGLLSVLIGSSIMGYPSTRGRGLSSLRRLFFMGPSRGRRFLSDTIWILLRKFTLVGLSSVHFENGQGTETFSWSKLFFFRSASVCLCFFRFVLLPSVQQRASFFLPVSDRV